MDVITVESSKLKKLKESYALELQQDADDSIHGNADDDEITSKQIKEKQRVDDLEFQIQCQLEAKNNRSLLQCVVSEAKASGYPMPPSLIKLLNSTNGKYSFDKHKHLKKQSFILDSGINVV